MATNLENLHYLTEWNDCTVDYYEGYHHTMVNFHMHDYYEVSLILAGSVKVLLPDHVQEGIEARLVLTAPKTPHFISRNPDIFYSRLNLLFSHDFVEDYIPEVDRLLSVFGERGRVILLQQEQKEQLFSQIKEIDAEHDILRRRLMLLCLLSRISEMGGESDTSSELPAHVTGALTYISEHYSEKIIAERLAWHLGVGRTTLMTSFKAYTGSTLNEYVIRCRAKNVLHLLRRGVTEQEAAERCGFGDTCNLIRGFKKCYGKTPRQYIMDEKEKNTGRA
ncbi:MAG: AraC family transcriptional regulator [Ruminococcaceae bacterium]|nr:AraC family transcriptional regulator [Oscillospiraceae bacterium]